MAKLYPKQLHEEQMLKLLNVFQLKLEDLYQYYLTSILIGEI